MVARNVSQSVRRMRMKKKTDVGTVAHDGVQNPYASTDPDRFVQQEGEHCSVYYQTARPRKGRILRRRAFSRATPSSRTTLTHKIPWKLCHVMTFSSEDDGYRDLLGFPYQPATA